MRLMAICSYYPPMLAPEAAHAFFLCRELAAHADVHLVTSAVGNPVAPEGFELHPVVRTWGWLGRPALARVLRKVRPDRVLLVYVEWIYGRHPMVTFLPSLCRSVLPGARVVTQFENVQFARHPIWHPALRVARRLRPFGGDFDPHFGTLLSGSDRLIFLSDRHLEAVLPGHPEVAAKARVIPAPPMFRVVDDPTGEVRRSARASLRIPDEDPLLVYFGYVYPSKGLETLVGALAELRDRWPRLRLLVVGGISDPPYGAKLRAALAAGNLNDRVIWGGHCEPVSPDGSVLLRAADVCVLPFDAGIRQNNSSFAVAARHGLPVVTTRGPDLEAAFRHGENVWLTATRDPHSLAEGIDRVLSDADLRRRLGEGSRAVAETNFSWDRTVRETLEVLESAPNHPAHGGHRPPSPGGGPA